MVGQFVTMKGKFVLDARIRPLIDPPLNRLGIWLAKRGISANGITLLGMVFGLAAAGVIALDLPYWAALVLVFASRLADGLDGAIARATRKTDFGGYLDIFCDFIFYAAIPLSFVFQDPIANGLAGALVIASFYVNAASFLGFALLADRHGMETTAQGQKSLYYASGLLEGFETILFFVWIIVFPHHFAIAATLFAGLCLVTAVARVIHAHQLFR